MRRSRLLSALLLWLSLQVLLVGQEGLFSWETIEESYPGIRIVRKESQQPRQLYMVAARVDLGQKGLAVRSNPLWAEDWQAGKRETLRETTRAFISRQRGAAGRVVLAINSNFYGPVGNSPGSVRLSGLAVSEGRLVSPSEPNRWALLIPSQGPARIAPSTPGMDLSGVQEAVGAYVSNLRQGQPQGEQAELRPRSVIGLCREQRYLFLLVIDGRRPGHSLGVTIREAGDWLRFFGAWDGINMDGGGSSTLAWINPENAAVELLSRPSDRQRIAGIPLSGSEERWNGLHLGIWLPWPKEEEEAAPTNDPP